MRRPSSFGLLNSSGARFGAQVQLSGVVLPVAAFEDQVSTTRMCLVDDSGLPLSLEAFKHAGRAIQQEQESPRPFPGRTMADIMGHSVDYTRRLDIWFRTVEREQNPPNEKQWTILTAVRGRILTELELANEDCRERKRRRGSGNVDVRGAAGLCAWITWHWKESCHRMDT